MITSLSPDWREWIQVNLQRNCSVTSMIEAMVAKGFEPQSAAAFIATVSNELQRPVANAQGAANSAEAFQYEACRLPTTNRFYVDDQTITVRLRIKQPEIILLEGVLSQDECDELVRRAEAKLNPSTTIDPATGEAKIIQNRTSYGTYFHLEEDGFIAKLDRRLAHLANWPLDHAEGIQILNYRQGGEYKPHFDFFPPEEAGSTVHTAQGGQRVATIVMYLNDVEEGGETIFPKLSLSIPARKGDAVYFAYCNSQGQVDRLTLHGGAPVLKDQKWIATKWMRQHRRR
jgi:prolyl 4-hydroxylase